MASSTTIPIARSMAKSVSRFKLKLKRYKKKKVPIIATGTEIAGIRVERKSCRKRYTTRNTSIKASRRVLIIFSIDASRNLLALTRFV
jgi:hypothetical protein